MFHHYNYKDVFKPGGFELNKARGDVACITFRENCKHQYEPTFQEGDTYRCSKCGKEIDMTED